MACSQAFLNYVMDLLSECRDISYRKMMGEYVLYCGGKVFGGVYDDRFLVKIVPASRELLGDAEPELPYEGGSPMLPVGLEDPLLVRELVERMEPQLPAPKKRKKSV